MNKKKIAEVQGWLDRHVIDPMWDHHSQISNDDIDLILEGKAWEVEDSLYEYNIDWFCEQEHDLLKYAIKEFELDTKPDELRDFVDVSFDMDLGGLVKWSSNIFIGARLGVEHYPDYMGKMYYADLKEQMEFFGIDPHDINPKWKSRNGREQKINVKDLLEIWLNCFYSGEWCALLDGEKVLQFLLKNPDTTELEIGPGASVTIYDFWNGSGSMIGTTLGPIQIKKSQLYNDGADSYGIQRCYGLVNEAWNGTIKQR